MEVTDLSGRASRGPAGGAPDVPVPSVPGWSRFNVPQWSLLDLPLPLRLRLRRRISFLAGLVVLHAERLADDRDELGVMDEPVEHGARDDGVGEHLSPGLEALVARHDDAAALVAGREGDRRSDERLQEGDAALTRAAHWRPALPDHR